MPCRVLQGRKREKRQRFQSETHSFSIRPTFAFHSIAVGGWVDLRLAPTFPSIHGAFIVCLCFHHGDSSYVPNVLNCIFKSCFVVDMNSFKYDCVVWTNSMISVDVVVVFSKGGLMLCFFFRALPSRVVVISAFGVCGCRLAWSWWSYG